MKISLTLSLLNVKVEYELLVRCVTLESACENIFLLKRFRNGEYFNTDMDCCLYGIFHMNLTCFMFY